MSDSLPREDGGPAFPTVIESSITRYNEDGSTTEYFPGMMLRDYFAAHAMSIAMLAARETSQANALPSDGLTARVAYRLADAMLAERQK